MTKNQVPKMSDDFLCLCKPLSFGENQELCEKRWLGVGTTAEKAGSEDVEAMIRIVFRSKQKPNQEIVDEIRQHFKAVDDLFLMSGNDTELEAMCAAVLLALIKGTANGTDSLAALSLETAAMCGLRKPVVKIDLLSRVKQSISQKSRQVRQRPNLKEITATASPKINLGDTINQIQNWESVVAALNSLANAVQASDKSLHSAITSAVTKAGHFMSIQDEELQMLWWVVSAYSLSMNRPFSELSTNARPLVFAKELADFTNVLPGPEGIVGILSHAGLSNDAEIKITDIINACDNVWLRALIDDRDPSPITLPIHFGIKRKLETGENNSWIPGWASVVDLGAEQTLSPLAVAGLFYRERLLTRLMREV